MKKVQKQDNEKNYIGKNNNVNKKTNKQTNKQIYNL